MQYDFKEKNIAKLLIIIDIYNSKPSKYELIGICDSEWPLK